MSKSKEEQQWEKVEETGQENISSGDNPNPTESEKGKGKIFLPLQQAFQKVFETDFPLRESIKIVLGLLLSLDYYYYLSDMGIPKVLSIALVTLFWYLVLSILLFLGQGILYVLKKINIKTLALYLGLGGVVHYFLPKLIDDDTFSLWQMRGIMVLVALIIFFFLKTVIAIFQKRKKWLLVPLLFFGVLFLGAISFMAFPGFNHNDYSYLPQEDPKYSIATTAKYQVERKPYHSDQGVSLLPYVSYDGLKKKVRDGYFHRGLDNVPIQGEIYLPKGVTDVPILFITHGNHRFTANSYLGYDYLGEYLASRGIAVVSVDMNMLNGFMKFGLSDENEARAILLLENMKYILESSPYKKAINSDKIVLAGHSRGGEAVTLGYLYNSLSLDPDKGKVKFHYHFNIKGLIGIAPTYGQYNPSDKALHLKNVNYLTIAGACDSDVTGFEGMNQYHAISFDENTDHFKAALYIGGANHGQFNSQWRDYDSDPPEGLNINRSILMSQADQEKITELVIYKFLENTFGQNADRQFFQEGPYAYSDFPKVPYYSCYQDSSYYNICNYEEDFNLKTTSRLSDRISFSNFEDIHEGSIEIGDGSSNSTGVFLDSEKSSSYQIFLGEKVPSKGMLTFDIENQNLPDHQPLNLQIILTDTMGNAAQVSTQDYAYLTPMTKMELTKTASVFRDYETRGALQTVRIPLADFVKNNPQIKVSEISKIEFQTGQGMGKFVLDNIGFTNE